MILLITDNDFLIKVNEIKSSFSKCRNLYADYTRIARIIFIPDKKTTKNYFFIPQNTLLIDV
jgi:hypothetical protein